MHKIQISLRHAISNNVEYVNDVDEYLAFIFILPENICNAMKESYQEYVL